MKKNFLILKIIFEIDQKYTKITYSTRKSPKTGPKLKFWAKFRQKSWHGFWPKYFYMKTCFATFSNPNLIFESQSRFLCFSISLVKMSLDITLHCIKKQVRSSVIIELKKYTKIWRHCFSLFVLFGIQAFANWWFLMKSNVELNKKCVWMAQESQWCSINRSPPVPFIPSSTTPDFTGIHDWTLVE